MALMQEGVAPPGWEQTVLKMKKSGKVDNPWALCLAGDTVIPCLDGQYLPLRTLAESPSGTAGFWVYAFDQSQSMIVPGRAYAQYAGLKQAVEITLDNKETILCSPEHRWVLRDGAFLETRSLRRGMCLMPFKVMRERAGHERVYQPGLACYVLTAWSVMRMIQPGCTSGGYLIHHKNENHRDNRPENLEWMLRKDHHKHHGAANVKAMRAGWDKKYKEDAAFVEGYVERGRLKTSKMWQDPVYREKMTEILRAQSQEGGRKAGEVHRAKKHARQEQQDKQYSENHVIRKIVPLDTVMPMYDVAVEGYHTFAIGAGVYSHNSWYMRNRGMHPHAEADEDPVFDAALAVALAEFTAALGDDQVTAATWSPAPSVSSLPETLGATVRATAAALEAQARQTTMPAVLYAEKRGGFQCRTCRYARPTNAARGRCLIVAGMIHLDDGVCCCWDADPAQLHLYREPAG